jgi:fatty-acid peroxygenase
MAEAKDGAGLAASGGAVSGRGPALAGVPRDPAFDSSLALLSEGYAFIPSRCRKFGSDLFETRIMLSKAVCMTGAEAAREFYRRDRFTRKRAMPPTTFMLIQDNGSVMSLDGEAHRRRKHMFLALMRRENLGPLIELTIQHFRARARGWERQGEVILLEEASIALCGAVCEWAGLRLTPQEVESRASEFNAMVDGTGSIGPRNWKGHLLRRRTERWARKVIAEVRDGARQAPQGSALQVIASFRDENGQPMDLASAGVELINVLRPTVANARYVAFAAMALRDRPELAPEIASDDAALERFVHEVRRFYPFIPLMAGRVIEEFDWRGRHFARGEWVFLDLYGTNRDPRSWSDPESFSPERFRDWPGDPYSFIPSGGGAHEDTHRCPGEWITIELVKAAAKFLASEVSYQVPPQDLTIDLSRIPALPRSRFLMSNVKLQSAAQ